MSSTAESSALVELRGVHQSFGSGETEVRVLEDVNWRLGKGEAVAVVGPSGSGKSTLLNLVGGLMQPTAGQVLFEGVDLAQRSAEQLADLRNQKMGFVFQSHHLLPQCTALENVLLPTLASGTKPETLRDRAEELLVRVGLEGRSSHRPAQLSGGERQRVAAVRALILQPELLLADEPTGSLDARSADSLGELLADLNQQEGVTMMVVTHSPRLAERMGHCMELAQGTLRGEGLPK